MRNNSIYKRQTSMSSAGFKPAILATERPQTQALESAVTGIGCSFFLSRPFLPTRCRCRRPLLYLITVSRTSPDGESIHRRELYVHKTQHFQQTDRHPSPQRDSNLQSQQPSSRRPAPYRAVTVIGWNEILAKKFKPTCAFLK